jgi:hypothetical protein
MDSVGRSSPAETMMDEAEAVVKVRAEPIEKLTASDPPNQGCRSLDRVGVSVGSVLPRHRKSLQLVAAGGHALRIGDIVVCRRSAADTEALPAPPVAAPIGGLLRRAMTDPLLRVPAAGVCPCWN